MYPPNGKPLFFADNIAPFTLTGKEIAKACEDVTIISRRQAQGDDVGFYLCCAIRVSTGLPIGVGITCPQNELSLAAQEIGRDLDKFYGSGGNMADAARDRPSRKPGRLIARPSK